MCGCWEGRASLCACGGQRRKAGVLLCLIEPYSLETWSFSERGVRLVTRNSQWPAQWWVIGTLATITWCFWGFWGFLTQGLIPAQQTLLLAAPSPSPPLTCSNCSDRDISTPRCGLINISLKQDFYIGCVSLAFTGDLHRWISFCITISNN